VENALYADSRVAEAIALGVPDVILGEKVSAVVSLRPGQSAAEEDLLDGVRPR
jgi:acyl-CoA synthetase (AMP-forming)/AMP-acid ligase II